MVAHSNRCLHPEPRAVQCLAVLPTVSTQTGVQHQSLPTSVRPQTCGPLAQGFIDAARAFQKEAGIEAGPSDEAADVRMHVRNALEQGQVDQAIEQVNDFNPEVCKLDACCWFTMRMLLAPFC